MVNIKAKIKKKMWWSRLSDTLTLSQTIPGFHGPEREAF